MKRPSSHVSADMGVAGAAKAFVSVGWACDPVHSDYGEDLILQTTLEGLVDPFRTLVQVRSSRRVDTTRRLTCRVSRAHALRWVRNAEPVLLVLWDLRADRGWYLLPSEQLNEYDLLLSTKQSVVLEFESGAVLTPDTIDRLGWSLRLEYFAKRMLAAADRDRDDEFNSEYEPKRERKHKGRLATVVFQFFRTVRIITRRGLSSEVRRRFSNAKSNIATHHYPPNLSADDKVNIKREASLLVLIAHVNQVTGVGIPSSLAETAAAFLLFLLDTRRKS